MTNSLLLTRQQAIDLLPFGRRGFDSLIQKGELGFKKVNGRLYFLRTDIEKWANDLEHHIDCISGVKHTGHTSHCKPKSETTRGLDALRERLTLEKLNNSVSKKLQSYNRKPSNKPVVNCLA